MAKQYLDKNGLSYFWTKLKAYFQTKLVSGTNIKTINNTSLLGSGNISISGGSGLSASDFVLEEVSIVDNLTVASGTSDGSKSVSKTGYKVLGVVGFRAVNGSTSGTNGAFAAITHAYTSGNTAYYRVRNVGTSSMKVRIYFTILYVKS